MIWWTLYGRFVIWGLYLIGALAAAGTVAHYIRAPLKAELNTLKAQIAQQKIDAEAILKRKTLEVAEKEKADKARVKSLERQANETKKSRDVLYVDNKRLADRLRERGESRGNPVPEATRTAPVDHDTCSRQLSATLQRMVEWAREADEVRQQTLTCQAFLR